MADHTEMRVVYPFRSPVRASLAVKRSNENPSPRDWCLPRGESFQRIVASLASTLALTLASTLTLMLASWLVAPAVCFADQVWTLSDSSPRAGLRWEISSSGAVGAGYLPLRVALETVPATPSPVDRPILFELELERNGNRDRFSREIVLPAGETRVTTTLPITFGKSLYWNVAKVKCSEYGQTIPELSNPLSKSYAAQTAGETELYPSILFVDRDAPPVGQRQDMINSLLSLREPVAAVLPRFLPLTARLCATYGGADMAATSMGGVGVGVGNSLSNLAASQPQPTSINDAHLLSVIASLDNVGLLSPGELPDQWLAISNYDVIFIPWPELQELARSASGRYAALRAWTSAGGVLCVHGIGERFVAQRALEAALKLSANSEVSRTTVPRTPPKPTASPDSPASSNRTALTARELTSQVFASAWRELDPLLEPKVVPLHWPVEEQFMIGQSKPAREWSDSSAALPQPLPGLPSLSFKTRARSLGLGLVVAIDTQDPWETSVENWGQLFHFIGEARFRPLQRLGLSRLSENPDFGTFVIPGVGRPPTMLFLCLITAFAIVIGPVNYHFLRKRRRLHWMFVTVPAAAFLAAFGLLAYAVLADGLGVRTRVASVTHVDQLASVTSSVSRQTYFAGITPRNGLQFPGDALVHPIERWCSLDEPRQRRTHAVFWSDLQTYTSGYVSPRTMSEWLVVAPQPSTLGLRIQMAAEGSGACRVRNELGVDLHALVICDEQGRHYFTSGLASNKEVKLDEQPWKEVFKLLYSAIPPQPPPTSGWETRRNNAWMFWSRQSMAGSFERSLLNNYRQQLLAGQQFEHRRGYLALAKQPVATPLGTTPAELIHDLHIVIGAW
jgi:hypothetical protein